jgi:multicomponent Na+:H+ antiporter subunit B
MSERFRMTLFFLFGLLFFGLFVYATLDMPSWGYYRGPYGYVISNLAVWERHTTDAVNAINYDYRAVDTLGEEFILFTAVTGVMLLLRREGKPAEDDQSGRVPDKRVLSLTIQASTIPATFLTVIFGLYIGLHGQLTPGGGFQAGVILSTAGFLVYLAQNTGTFVRITSHTAMEFIEALGAGGYALIGVTPLLVGAPFLTNWIPLGATGDIFSSGTIAIISATVGVEVTAAFLLVAYTYLQEIIRGRIAAE